MSIARKARRERERLESKSDSASETPSSKERPNWKVPFFTGLAGLLVGSAIRYGFLHTDQIPANTLPPTSYEAHSLKLSDILEMTPEQLSTVDIAEVNLLCATGLSGSEKFDIAQGLKTLDRWADAVQGETSRNFHRFKRNPAEYDNSEAFYRMGMLITVLQQDMGIHYNEDLIGVSENDAEEINKAFLTDPSNMFITGILGPNRAGTCSSMPVLYVAIGRRLGYPVKLVVIKDHFFVRWEGRDGTKLNIEGTGHGIVTHPDSYYVEWRKISSEDIAAGRSLKSLTREQELAAFLINRSGVLAYHNRLPEAMASAAEASRLWPEDKNSKSFLAAFAVKLAPEEFKRVSDKMHLVSAPASWKSETKLSRPRTVEMVTPVGEINNISPE